jgi:hypothetical protein
MAAEGWGRGITSGSLLGIWFRDTVSTADYRVTLKCVLECALQLPVINVFLCNSYEELCFVKDAPPQYMALSVPVWSGIRLNWPSRNLHFYQKVMRYSLCAVLFCLYPFRGHYACSYTLGYRISLSSFVALLSKEDIFRRSCYPTSFRVLRYFSPVNNSRFIYAILCYLSI